MLHINILGETEIWGSGGRIGVRALGGAKPRRILEILLLASARTVGKDRLADLVWDGAPPASYVSTLDSYVCVLRKHLEPGRPARDSVVVTAAGGYRLDTARVRLDVDEFDELVEGATGLPAAHALPRLDRALALVRGDLLEHEPDAPWAEPARAMHRARLADAVLRAGACALALGDPDRAIAAATRALAIDDLSEPAWRLRIRGNWASGRRADAIRDYETCRELLAGELGLRPDGETRELLRTMSGSTELAAAVAGAVAAALGRHPRPVPVPGDAQLARWADGLLAELSGPDPAALGTAS